MPCIAAPTIGAPSLSAGVSIPGLSATLGGGTLAAQFCCTFVLPIPSSGIVLPPLGVGATVAIEALTIAVKVINAFTRELLSFLKCPLD